MTVAKLAVAKMARITLLTVGSRGDVQPFCAIARQLIARGHDVTLATSFNFANFVTQQDIDFAPIAGDFKQLLSSPEGLELLEGNTSVNLISDDLLWQQLSDAWRACQDAELLVFSPLALWGYHIAEALGIPAILASSVPVAATKEFPFLQFASERTDSWVKGKLNRLSYQLVGILGWRRKAEITNRFRTEVLNLSKLPWLGARYRKDPPPFLSKLPVIHLFSESAIAPPSDWNANVHQVGFCFLDTATDFKPGPALQEFLNKSPRPFYVGLGSMISRNPNQLARTILLALEKAGQRAIFCSGWGDIKQTDLPSSVYLLEKVPHDWLFPQVAAAIHHGGAGTTAATLRAGIPSIVVSFFADQPIWGKLLEKLGVSPATYPQSELNSNELAASLRALVENVRFRAQSQRLQSQIQNENGAEEAAKVIESYLS